MNITANCAELQGQVVDGRFRLLRRLGGSQDSSVYQTEVEADGARKAAIKLVAARADDAEIHITGWKRAAGLSHPHLTRVLHTGQCTMDGGEVAYAVLEFADEVLAEILPERALTPDETREMLGPVLDGLAYLHGHGVAHGRLKPSNILVVEDGLKLSADCIAFASRAAVQPDESDTYAAPEMARGEISAAADIWSLGMTLVATLTQKAPVWERASNSEPVVPAAVPEPFAEIARACLRLDPAKRCTLGWIKERLEPETAQLQQKPVNMPASPRPSKSRPAVFATVAVVLVMAVIVAVWHFRQTPAAAPTTEQAATQTTTPAAPPPPSEAAPVEAAAPANPPATAPLATSEPQAEAVPGGTAKGEVVKRVQPDVLPAAQASIHGKVVVNLRVNVDANGDVSNASPESPQVSRYFTRVAVEAAREWKFSPPQAQGKAAASVWALRFEFHRDGIETTATEASQ
jgi:TonB family protein